MPHRVARAVCVTNGLGVPLRGINKHIRGLSDNYLEDELKYCAKNGLEDLHGGPRRSMTYFKLHPSTLTEDNPMIKSSGISLEWYTISYLKTVQMTNQFMQICRQFHPYSELLLAILSRDIYSNNSD